MDENEYLAGQFEQHRPRLRAVAYRILGSGAEAEDAVQEAWIRLARSDAGEVRNLAGWLTTVVARVCLNLLQSRKSRREEPLETRLVEPAGDPEAPDDPEHEAVLADSVGLALLVVLETLTPAERLAFVLHDMFAVPFEEIAPIVGRSESTARQLASRARRRVRGVSTVPDTGNARQREVVSAFLAASRAGQFEALLAVLDPEVVLRADATAVSAGASNGVRGIREVAKTFSGRALGAKLALVDGLAGAVWAPGGQTRVVFGFTVVDGKITAINLMADPDLLDLLDLEVLET